jgi:hypothetical protein
VRGGGSAFVCAAAPLAFVALVVAACASDYSTAPSATPDASADAHADATVAASNDGANGTDAVAPDGGEGDASTDGGTPATSPYTLAVLADNPVVYYRFEEAPGATTAASSVTGSPDGMIDGTPTLGVAGRVGHAYDFGVSVAADVDVSALGFDFIGNAPFTLEAWFYATMTDVTYRHMFMKDTLDQAAGRQEYGVTIQSGELGFERYVDGTGNVAKAAVTVNAWHHFAGVYDGVALSLYLDGALASATTDSRAAKPKDKPLVIGARDVGSAASVFPGSLDEVAIYDHALTGARIAAHIAAAP